MPILDKPLSELRTYQGTNPRPADFDKYWSESLAELDRTPPEAEFARNPILSVAHVECFDLRFKGIGGALVYAKFLRPANATNCPAVLQFHGYGANSGDWSQKLAYVSQGFCVAAMDCRGQGGLSEDVGGTKGTTLRGQIVRGLEEPDPKRLLFRSIFLDAAQLARLVISLPEIDDSRVGTSGASQGGALALACAALEPRINRAAPLFPFLSDYQRVWEMDLTKGAYEEIAYYLRRRDPTHRHAREMFERLGYIDVQHLAPRIKAEVLMFTGLMDDVCPPSTQFAVYNKLAGPKEMLIYPDFGHEFLPDSDDRVFNFMMQMLS